MTRFAFKPLLVLSLGLGGLWQIAGIFNLKGTSLAVRPEWVIDNTYRLAVQVDSGESPRAQTPVGLEVDFIRLLQDQGISGRLDRESIRIVRHDPASGRALPYQAGFFSYPVPYQLSRDFFYGDSGTLWWRIQDRGDLHFHIYFDILERGPKAPPGTLALVGNGDLFHYNSGRTGPLDVSMSASVRYLDWDGDGRKDLLVGSSQTHEYGVSVNHGYIYFFKNVGTNQEPLFAPGYQLRDREGNYVQTVSGKYTYFDVVDTNLDGNPDLVMALGPELYAYENSGSRDRDGLPLLNPRRSYVKLARGNDFADSYYYKFPRFVDWNGDGDLDIVYGVYKQQMEPGCDNTEKICYWDEVVQFYEFHENLAGSASATPSFAPPRVIRTARGLLLNTFNYGGEDYSDWTGNGNLDMLVGDMRNYPSGASRIMLYENVGTRTNPSLLMGVPLIDRIEEIGRGANPLVVDWNNNGRKDLLVAGAEGWIKVYLNQNHDPASRPVLGPGHFVQQLHPRITEGEQSRTVAVDWDGDGLLDLIRGGGNGWVTWYRNIGTTLDPVFAKPVRLQADGAEIRLINGPRDCPQGPSEPHAGYTAPVVVDWDGDGDLDLIVGDMRGYQTYFENVGSRNAPRLAAGRLITVDGEPRTFGWRNQLAVGDLDGDGEIDIVSTSYTDRRVFLYKREPSQPDAGVLRVRQVGPLRLESGDDLLPPHAGGNNNGDYMLKLADWDNDGTLDLFVGTLYHIWYYENVGGPQNPVFRPHGKIQCAGADLYVSGHAGSVEVVDWNGSGQKDILIGGESGWTYYFERSFLEGDLPEPKMRSFEIRP